MLSCIPIFMCFVPTFFVINFFFVFFFAQFDFYSLYSKRIRKIEIISLPVPNRWPIREKHEILPTTIDNDTIFDCGNHNVLSGYHHFAVSIFLRNLFIGMEHTRHKTNRFLTKLFKFFSSSEMTKTTKKKLVYQQVVRPHHYSYTIHIGDMKPGDLLLTCLYMLASCTL